MGEFVVSGPTVTPGYLGDRGDDAFEPAGLRTGDVGYRDADGRLWVIGRTDDLIVTGGENVAPAEVVERLRDHPDVADAAVVGLPDEEWGERVAALVVPREERPLGRRPRRPLPGGTGGLQGTANDRVRRLHPADGLGDGAARSGARAVARLTTHAVLRGRRYDSRHRVRSDRRERREHRAERTPHVRPFRGRVVRRSPRSGILPIRGVVISATPNIFG
ncbi:hypothetical protein ACFQL0_13625 [Haloplanus litoreus]